MAPTPFVRTGPRRARVVAAMLCLTVGAAIGHAQRPALAEPTQYLGILERYRSGDTDPAVAALVAGGEDLLRDGDAARRGAGNELLAKARAGAMLHTDATAALWPADRRIARRHLDLAAEWARLAGKLGDDPFERRWTLAAGLLLAELGSREGRVEAALEHFDRACARYGQDVPLLLAAAWLEERTAVAPLPLTASAMVGRVSDAAAQDKRVFLARARDRLERAERVAPDNTEVIVRWAHVQLALGDARSARRRLERLVAEPAAIDRPDAYLSQVFLGQALLVLGETDRAVAAFDAAIALLPGAQTARLGRLGAQWANPTYSPADDSLDWLRDEAETTDPWLDYLVGRLALGPLLRTRLRQDVRQ